MYDNRLCLLPWAFTRYATPWRRLRGGGEQSEHPGECRSAEIVNDLLEVDAWEELRILHGIGEDVTLEAYPPRFAWALPPEHEGPAYEPPARSRA